MHLPGSNFMHFLISKTVLKFTFNINKFANNFRNADTPAFDNFFLIYRTPLSAVPYLCAKCFTQQVFKAHDYKGNCIGGCFAAWPFMGASHWEVLKSWLLEARTQRNSKDSMIVIWFDTISIPNQEKAKAVEEADDTGLVWERRFSVPIHGKTRLGQYTVIHGITQQYTGRYRGRHGGDNREAVRIMIGPSPRPFSSSPEDDQDAQTDLPQNLKLWNFFSFQRLWWKWWLTCLFLI